MSERVVLLSIPQLRRVDVTPGALASLDAVAAKGGIRDLVPTFPGLSASSFATLVTGVGPRRHGVIGNTYFDRAGGKLVRPPLPDSANEAPKIWNDLRQRTPGARTMLWFAPNSEGAEVEVSAGLDACWQVKTSPEGLGETLMGEFGDFPRPGADPEGEPPRLEATRWILQTAAHAIRAERPELAIVRVPYLGQVARRFGPDGREAQRAVCELETVLKPFLEAVTVQGCSVMAATESISTPVSGHVEPNRVLRELGLLKMVEAPGGGLDVDLQGSAAFSVADHQLCHVYVNNPSEMAAVAAAFSGEHADGIALVAPNGQRAKLGLDHPRSGDVVLVAHPDRWFSCSWWEKSAERPDPARCRSGLPPAKVGVPIDAEHVLGSMGAPPADVSYLGVVVSSSGGLFDSDRGLGNHDLASLILRDLTGAETPAE
jgi:predicted AlkP superfamily pyrophosphatase or phosphodiesterase